MRARLIGRYPLLVAFCTGAAVMVLEVVGTRIIGTFYGSSVQVWGALITVTLVSLSIGYWIGGRLADRWPKAGLLYVVEMLAGAAIPATLFSRRLMVACYQRFGMSGGALVSALLIFTLPLVLLAVVSPFVIRLSRRADGRIGRVAGAVYAISTLGSVVGTLAATLVLIPYAGTRLSMCACGAAVVAVTGVGLLLQAGVKWMPAAAALLAAAFLPTWYRPSPPKGLRFEGDSVYGRLLVVEKDDQLCLLVNGVMQTGMPLDIDHRDRGDLLRDWNYYFELLPYFNPPWEGKTALIIGLGGGMAGRMLDKYGIETTGVELDPAVARIATDLDLFGYTGEVVVGDGRRYLEDHDRQFDFCVLDAYSADVIPFHLVTREMFEVIRSRLTEEGVLGINYIGQPGGWVVGSLVKTLQQVFADVRVYRTTEEDRVQTLYLFASKLPLRLIPAWPGAGEDGVDAVSYNLERLTLDLERLPGQVLTDDLNPVDVRRTQTSLAWRERTIEAFGEAVVAY